MKARIDLMHVTQASSRPCSASNGSSPGGFDHGLLDLVRMRASQINGCSYCLDMHSKDARANGRPNSGSTASTRGATRRTTSERERAALEWTEALTLVSGTRVPDDVYERVRSSFGERAGAPEPGDRVINGWNRLNIAARTVPRLRGRQPREVARGDLIAPSSSTVAFSWGSS